jgi:hypothetical protein
MRECDNPQCGKDYPPRRSWQRFCSSKCRHDYFKLRMMTYDDVRRIVRLEVKSIKESSD